MKNLRNVVLAMLLMVGQSFAVDAKIFSPSGRYVGRATTVGSSTRYYGSSGKYVGRSNRVGSSTRFYSKSGAFAGRIQSSKGKSK